MTMVLYQFPLSHFCEKVRWALDYKGIECQYHNLLPGLHIRTTARLGKGSSVPILVHEGRSIQGSEQIITYLDEHFGDKRLTPVNSQEAQAALEWERYCNQEIGIHVRRYLYYELLQHPKVVVGLFAANGPFWQRWFLRVIFPPLRSRMKHYMDINRESAEQSRMRVLAAIDRLNEHLSERDYLVGGRFSRADLTAAALLAPLFMPEKYGINWPGVVPEPLQSQLEAVAPKLEWARMIYQKHR